MIAAVNDAVELRSFQEIIPSMNDIFIRVSGSMNGKVVAPSSPPFKRN